MEHRFRATSELPFRRDHVFAFFADAANLERITPPELRFHIVNPVPVDLREGAVIDYALRLFTVPFRWRTLISRWEPPYLFVDEQVRGPYTSWIHTHTFETTGGERTAIRDDVRYRLPFSPLSEVVSPLIGMQIRRIFAFRKHAIEQAFAGMSGKFARP